jgi:hypothetical protein
VGSKVGKNNLLKKSILLIKTWFTYEANMLGSYAACLATYGLHVLVIFIINNYYDELQTPMDVFKKFFEVWGKFNWDSNIVTIYNPIKAHNFNDTLSNEVHLFIFITHISACLTLTDSLSMKGASTTTSRIDHSLFPLNLSKMNYSSTLL